MLAGTPPIMKKKSCFLIWWTPGRSITFHRPQTRSARCTHPPIEPAGNVYSYVLFDQQGDVSVWPNPALTKLP